MSASDLEALTRAAGDVATLVTMAADFAAQAADLAGGVRLLLGIIESDSLDAGCCDESGGDLPRLLGEYETGVALRFCITALDLLGAHAADRLQNEVVRAEREGGAT